MNDLTKPVYLGDALYAAYDGYQIVLYASNGETRTNTVYLEPAVLAQFFSYVDELKKAVSERQPCVSEEPLEIVVIPWKIGN